MKKLLLFVTMLVLMTANCMAMGQRRLPVEERETINRTLNFSTGGGPKTLEVDNVNGRIRVTGYDGGNVEMVANKIIRAQSQATVQVAQQQVRLDITDNADTIKIYVDQPGHERSTQFSSHSNWSNRDYEVTFDFDLRVPRTAEIHLWTVNGGPIEVNDVAGDFNVNNINGAIEMRNISGSGGAHTINGAVSVDFANNPKGSSRFGSLNGDIEVTFRRDLSADLKFKTFNGGVYTDFPVTAVPTTLGSAERRNGKLVYRNEFSQARIGNGGPTLEFDGFNGNVRIRQAK
jgi:hypothetical protein